MLIRFKVQKSSNPKMPESFKREGDEVEAKALETLKNHGDLNQPDENGDTLLIKLIRYGREETALKMIRAGADVNARGFFWGTALHEACSCDASEEIIEELIAHKADINAQDNFGDTPLMKAVFWRQEKAVEILLKHNANTSLTERNKKTVFIMPRYKKSDKIEQMLKKALLEQKKEAHQASRGRNPIAQESFKREGDVVEAKALEALKNHGDLNQPGKYDDTLLIKLIRYGREETALKLISAGADVNAKSELGSTALHEACIYGASEEIIEELIAHGANINAQDRYGSTPLMKAVFWGNEKAVEILLNHNANTSLTERNKKTVFTIPKYKKSNKIKEMLKEAKIKQNKEAYQVETKEDEKAPKEMKGAEKAPKEEKASRVKRTLKGVGATRIIPDIHDITRYR